MVNLLGLTLPCTVRSNPAARSILNRQASSTISASTVPSVSKMSFVACDDVGRASGRLLHTQNLISFTEPKRHAILVHELAILFRTFSSHLGGIVCGFRGRRMAFSRAITALFSAPAFVDTGGRINFLSGCAGGPARAISNSFGRGGWSSRSVNGRRWSGYGPTKVPLPTLERRRS